MNIAVFKIIYYHQAIDAVEPDLLFGIIKNTLKYNNNNNNNNNGVIGIRSRCNRDSTES